MQCPMAAVPCGSGNGLAASAGLWDPVTAVVSVCRGRTEAVDVASVLQPPGNRFYCLLSVVYGSMVRGCRLERECGELGGGVPVRGNAGWQGSWVGVVQVMLRLWAI